MRNGEHTRNRILKESANLFNTQGYKATSISDITKATGLTKGAIYRHFDNKSDLEQQALHSLGRLMFSELGTTIQKAPDFKSKMQATFSFFEKYMHTPLYEGGCPLMNAAVEADDTNSILRKQALQMLSQLKISLERIIENGIKNGQVQEDTDANYYATIFIATLEGGIMMSKLEQNSSAILSTISHLKRVVESIEK
ncbi:MAG: TetR/AcrR family transcriptional regulator [Marinirhabdus sp.]|nr:TetR/AcrR family transcriptional regulator [Marinirhabdus sp.]